jgi:hypothetical protein
MRYGKLKSCFLGIVAVLDFVQLLGNWMFSSSVRQKEITSITDNLCQYKTKLNSVAFSPQANYTD